ncbi:MAG: NAD(+)/NADH kinase [Ignavibacteriales bacterium]|nr:NAD(+)/NADH kinase [Ignavibacteriales bacterium]
MKFAIIPNMKKENIIVIVKKIIDEIIKNGFDFILSDRLTDFKSKLKIDDKKFEFLSHNLLVKNCDYIISIGGDGTMLQTAYEARNTNAPLIGINFGKLGFLAEFDVHNISKLFKNLKQGTFVIEKRMTLEGVCLTERNRKLFAINDIVIEKGKYPKMIQMSVSVNDDYVTEFSADGVIIATPTGSTGYALSTGGPVIQPTSDVISLNPISPHTLNMRPLVLSDNQKITIEILSAYENVQISCDGQRVDYFKSPAKIEIYKGKKILKLVKTKSTNYFNTLRNKLHWGIDIRNENNKEKR